MGKDKVFPSYFQEAWLSMEPYKHWIKRHPRDPKSAICTFCNKEFKLSNMAVQSLKSHIKGDKHKAIEKARSPLNHLFFTKTDKSSITIQAPASSNLANQPSTSQANQPSTSSQVPNQPSTSEMANLPTSAQSTLDDPALPPDAEIALNAEIRWTLKCVKSHFSYRSNLDNNLLFRAMTPGYKPFEKYQMSRDKVAYFIRWGLAPVFENILMASIKESPFFSLLFDESLNYNLQKTSGHPNEILER
jgi:hypothetical protein